MRFFLVRHATCVRGKVLLLGDKSIACRSIIISAISCGKTRIENFPANEDSLSAIKTFKNLGIKIAHHRDYKTINVFGNGLLGLKKPKGRIFVGESGTTMRLTLGVLAGQDFAVTLSAGKSLSQRPMLRVTAPLRMMGAVIKSKVKSKESKMEEYPPITIKGGRLKPIIYKLPVASAQVKSAILLAGLYANGKTCVIEPLKTRDHTERMLRLFKADIRTQQGAIIVKGRKGLVSPGKIFIPGDISSASFFMVLSTIIPNSRILIKNVNLNPSRIGIMNILRRMGADIKVKGEKPHAQRDPALYKSTEREKAKSYEPVGDLLIESSSLKGVIVKKEEVPPLIDELPILMVAACFAKGRSVFEGVSELRVKETDRIKSMSENLKKMGADIRVIKAPESENVVVCGGRALMGTSVKSFGDHRTAMSMVVAGLAAQGQTHIDDISCINKSFPNFLTLLKRIIHN